jgi:hypothetical protein
MDALKLCDDVQLSTARLKAGLELLWDQFESGEHSVRCGLIHDAMQQEVRQIEEIVNRHFREERPPDPAIEKIMAEFDAKLPSRVQA